MTWYIVLAIVGVGLAVAVALWFLMGRPPDGTRSSQEPWWREGERWMRRKKKEDDQK